MARVAFRLSHLVFDRLPVWLVTAPYPGLEGAGVALQSLLEGV